MAIMIGYTQKFHLEIHSFKFIHPKFHFGNSFFRNLFKSLPLFSSKLCSTVCAFVLSPLQLFETTSPVAHRSPLSMGFPRQKYWSSLPFPPPGDLPDPGIKPTSLKSPTLIGGFFMTVPQSSTVKMVKNPPVMQETGVKSLGQEDLLEKKIAVHSSILAWRIPWTEEPGELQSRGGLKDLDMTKQLTLLLHLLSFNEMQKMNFITLK